MPSPSIGSKRTHTIVFMVKGHFRFVGKILVTSCKDDECRKNTLKLQIGFKWNGSACVEPPLLNTHVQQYLYVHMHGARA